MPPWLCPPVRRAFAARDAANVIIADWIKAADHSTMSPLISGTIEWAASQGWTHVEQAAVLYSSLWAIMANASFAGCALL